VTRCRKGFAAVAALLSTVVAAAGCGGSGGPKEVVLVTHDSFALSPAVRKAFEEETGLNLRILQTGDAGEVVTRALLTAGNPEGDVLFGVDNNLLARTLSGDVFEPYESPELGAVDPALVLDEDHRVTPIDRGDVCLNVDKTWFSKHGLAAPTGLDQLTLPAYRELLVVENPATSTPGLAFLLATIATYGNGWKEYWSKLRDNGVLVVDGWEDAYLNRFSGAAGSSGDRPIVVSYASSPPAEVLGRKPQPTEAPTGVVEDSCFRQVEFAGVLRGAKNPDGARKLVDFMLSKRFQEDIPLQMYVFPAREDAALPRAFERFAVVPDHPLELPPAEIDAHREKWIDQWTDTVVR
jgi:thiamine transport system substrate-binding protein